jgi:hypothetical protein
MSDPLVDALFDAAKMAAALLPAADIARLTAALRDGGLLSMVRTDAGWITLEVRGFGVLATVNPDALRPARMT